MISRFVRGIYWSRVSRDVNEKKEVKRGTLISILEVNGDITQRPADHTVRFAGEYPCDKNGMQITKIVNAVGTQEIIPVRCDKLLVFKQARVRVCRLL